jgi:hypothetical protein
MADYPGLIVEPAERLGGVIATGKRPIYPGLLEKPPDAAAKIYNMRAKRISTGAFIHWKASGAPDLSGGQSGVTPSDLTDILITSVK